MARRTRVNHLNAMLFGNLDNLIAGEVGSNGGVLASLADDVGFISLCDNGQRLSTSWGLF